MMTREEFKKRCEENEEWAPGWEAIDAAFEALYPGQNPAHYGTQFHARAIFGGEEYLDGYSIYTSPKGYQHLVTYGMTELYADADQLGGQWNKWGYEMTMKLAEPDAEHCLWAVNVLANLARYTYRQERYFEPNQFIAGSGPLHMGTDSAITSLLVVADTEAEAQDTIYGRTEFMQLVGITAPELEALRQDPDRAEELRVLMQADNPDLVTDMNRTHSYIKPKHA